MKTYLTLLFLAAFLPLSCCFSTGNSVQQNCFSPKKSAFGTHVERQNCGGRSYGLHAVGLSEAWESYNQALESSPLITKSITASIILGSADLTGQFLEKQNSDEKEIELDIFRVARFAFFGLVLQAPWNHFYYMLLDGTIPPTPEPFTPTTGIKVFIDQFIQAPIFTVLIFGFLGTLEGKTLDEVKKQLDDDYVDTMLANWKLFIPATVINLGFMPNIYRVLFLNVVFFFWSIYLSLKLNKDQDDSTSG